MFNDVIDALEDLNGVRDFSPALFFTGVLDSEFLTGKLRFKVSLGV